MTKLQMMQVYVVYKSEGRGKVWVYETWSRFEKEARETAQDLKDHYYKAKVEKMTEKQARAESAKG